MSRDFAKNNYTKKTASYGKTRNSNAKSQTQPWLWLLAGVVFGLLIAAVFYLKEHPFKGINHLKRESGSIHEALLSHKKIQLTTKSEPEPQFDFYSMLPKMQDESADTENNATNSNNNKITSIDKSQLLAPTLNNSNPVAKPPTLAAVTSNKHQISAHKAHAHVTYMLQVAAYKHFKDSDKLKAELTLLGFNVILKPVLVNNQTWNRVLIGPFKNQKSVVFAQHQLIQQGLKGNVIKEKT